MAALTSAMVITSAANAGSHPAPAPLPVAADRAMVYELARTLRISPDQALARLGREAAFARTEQHLRGVLGGGFGGAYLDADASTLTVAVTSAADSARVRAAGAVPVTVAHSEALLVHETGRLDRRAAAAPKQ